MRESGEDDFGKLSRFGRLSTSSLLECETLGAVMRNIFDNLFRGNSSLGGNILHPVLLRSRSSSADGKRAASVGQVDDISAAFAREI